MAIDLHVHSSVSDGTDTPTRLVLAAVEAGLTVIALTDHDTFDGLHEAAEAAKRVGLEVLGGVEISCEREGVSVHLVAYGCDPTYRPLLDELARIRGDRRERIVAMVGRLVALGLDITIEDVAAQAAQATSIGRPHVADALVAKGYVADRAEAFDRFLHEGGPAYVPRYACELERAIRLVHRAKGVAVIAHPWGRGSRHVLPAEYLEHLARDLELDGIEVEHPDHDAATRALLTELGYRTGLIRTGVSDYHGTGKSDTRLGLNTTRASGYSEILKRIRQRGGVVPA